MMSLILILSRPFNFEGREPYLCDFGRGGGGGGTCRSVIRHLQTVFFETCNDDKDL